MSCLLCTVATQKNSKLVALSTLLLVKCDSVEAVVDAMCLVHQKLARDTFAAAKLDSELSRSMGAKP